MVKLISLNIERRKHLDERILPFLREEQPDILCLQEVYEADVQMISEAMEATDHRYRSMMYYPEADTCDPLGVAILSRYPVVRYADYFYNGSADDVPVFDNSNSKRKFLTSRHVLLVCDIQTGEKIVRVGTTHFPVTDRGEVADFQRASIRKLTSALKKEEGLILCGDFNAPRGGEIFGELAARYTDHIPKKYKTSIDLELHRNAYLRPQELADKMVDGLFSTPEYTVKDVRLHCGVSDHCAVVASIERGQSVSKNLPQE